MRRSVLLLVAVSVVAASTVPALGRQQASLAALNPTDANRIQIWNTSLKLIDKTMPQIRATDARWRSAFKQMATFPDGTLTPDVLSVLEVPYKARDIVLNEIEAQFGTTYDFIHSDATSSACTTSITNDCGNTMIAFRTPRMACVPAGACDVLRWKKLEKGDGRCQAMEPNPGQVAVLLNDAEQGKNLVVASVHYGAQDPVKCLPLNIKRTNDKIERKWPLRPLTIWAGDFNKTPQDHGRLKGAADYSEEYRTWRREENPSCWYRRLSQDHTGDECAVLNGKTWSFPYYDTVWETQSGRVNGSDAICTQWTLFNTAEHTVADGNRCDSRKNRIDYIWVRYETPDGKAVVKDAGSPYPVRQIDSAGTDQGFYDPTLAEPNSGDEVYYSDHRAVHARVYWCEPTVSKPDTPCANDV